VDDEGGYIVARKLKHIRDTHYAGGRGPQQTYTFGTSWDPIWEKTMLKFA